MIATPSPRTLAFLAAVLAALLAGCASRPPRTTSLLVAALQRERQAAQGERERIQRALWRLQQGVEEDRAALAAVREQAGEVSRELAAALAALDDKLRLLRSAEEDLAEAKARMAEIEEELAPLDALERRLADKDAEMAALQEKLDTAERELAERQDRVTARLAELQGKARALEALDRRIEEALDSIGEAAGPFRSPAAAPAGSEPRPAGEGDEATEKQPARQKPPGTQKPPDKGK